MTYSKTINGDACLLSVSGRLDTMTSPELENELDSILQADTLTVDCSELDYISSAGLRFLMIAHKAFLKKSGMILTNIKESIKNILEVSGFIDIFNIK